LQLWGAKKLLNVYGMKNKIISPASVKVEMEFNEGYACCGGSDPDCYCSYAESPSANVAISGLTKDGVQVQFTMNAQDFDFVTVLNEMNELAEGEENGK
jgi:hypothetical protein